MNQVFSSDDYSADIANFSTITANSTAGCVAASLALKGINMTLAPGHHAGLQCCAYVFEMLRERRARAVVAAAADEIYPQTYYNYDLIGFLYQNENEENYRLHADEAKRKVIGEGAGALLLETLTSVRERKAAVWGELLGYGMAMDLNRYDAQCLEIDGIVKAVTTALHRSDCSASDIDCVVWAPQGNAQDFKVVHGLKSIDNKHFDRIPFVATTFNTGYIESASALLTLGVVLDSLRESTGIWPQRSGLSELDQRVPPEQIQKILVLGSSDLGYTFALIVATNPEFAE
jgi:3-oxoacyl-[acyl-carrier-protein] synthase II